MAHATHRRAALTMVELLVVSVILIILGGISMAAFSAAKRGAKNSACIANLSQQYSALMLYAGDNDQYLPVVGTIGFDRSTPLRTDVLKSVLAPYGLVDTQFYCPLDTYARQEFVGDNDWFTNTSYSFRFYQHSLDGTTLITLPVSLASIPEPSDFFIAMDQTWTADLPNNRRERLTAHGAWGNLLYADGRIKRKANVQPMPY